ncbi:hypothetical protein KJ641_04170 [Patescibacteria group bacterium]|nr:hypothetical protein [Patescibacteria group bacterium]
MFEPSTKTFFKRWKILVLVGILVAILSSAVSLLFPIEYRADTEVLIISRQQYGVDPYTVAKSAERIAESLSQAIKTDDFYQRVLESSDQSIDTSRFTNVEERIKRKRWQKAVEAKAVFGTSLMTISAYHKDPNQAAILAKAVSDTIVLHGSSYVGTLINIKVVNTPVVSRWPARPNILLNAFLGFLIGILIMGVAVVKKGRRRLI